MAGRTAAQAMASALLVLTCHAHAGLVHTRSGRVEGAVAFRNGRVEVAGKAVAWDDVLIAVRETPGRRLSAGDVVTLRSGEAWVVDVLALVAGRLKVRFPVFGEREVEIARIATLDFVPGLAPPTRQRTGTLYREKGEPVPGKLLWLDAQNLAIDSPLGVIEFARRDALRYVFANGKPASAPRHGEAGLVDGSILHGKLTPAKDGFELDHAVLGKLMVPGDALRSILRHSDRVAYLAEMEPKIDAKPLVAQAVAPKPLAYPGVETPWLKGVEIAPKTSLRYRLPVAGARRFRATPRPLPGIRGDLRLRVLAGGKTLLDQELTADGAWSAIDLDVPGADLTIEVDFGTRIRFPCGVTLCDPHVVSR